MLLCPGCIAGLMDVTLNAGDPVQTSLESAATGRVSQRPHSNPQIAQGSFHGAEGCDLVGLLILDKITSILVFGNIGLNREDGFVIIEQTSGT